MTVLKRILTYTIWTLIAFIFAIVYMLIILGSKPEIDSGFQIVIDLFYIHIFLYIGLIIGSIIAFLFILMDAFYLRKRLSSNKNTIIIRLGIMLAITAFVGIVHYFLEKVIDVI